MGASGPPRLGAGPVTTALQLGPLASLRGAWQGTGFNAIWRPDNNQPPENSAIKRFLELNMTSETLEFQTIPGVVPNRGFNTQPDLGLYGLHYLQRISDADPSSFSTGGQALHIEPGLFMNVPKTETPDKPASIVRMGSIPHGVTVLMQGEAPSTAPKLGAPAIPALVPFEGFPGLKPFTNNEAIGIKPIDANGEEHVVPEVKLAADVKGTQSNGPYPEPPFKQEFVADPNSVLRNAIAHQTILGNIELKLSTVGVDCSLGNIPFLGTPNQTDPTDPTEANAFVYSASATFWIEWVQTDSKHPLAQPPAALAELPHDGTPNPLTAIEPFAGKATHMQLQYSQLVILIFNNVLWPHVTVGTLTLSAG
jgi:hypothetical protein